MEQEIFIFFRIFKVNIDVTFLAQTTYEYANYLDIL